MEFVLVEEYGHGVQEDAYINGDDNVDAEYEEIWAGLDAWLKENIHGGYSFDRDYQPIDYTTIKISLSLLFNNEEDAIAFKLKWL